MRVSERERWRRYRDHRCVSYLGPGWQFDGETICGLCGRWFYWDKGYCNEVKRRRFLKRTKRTERMVADRRLLTERLTPRVSGETEMSLAPSGGRETR